MKPVGANHIRCQLADEFGHKVKAMAFRAIDTDLGRWLLQARGKQAHFAGTVKLDTWNGRQDVTFFIDDILLV